VSAFGCVTSCRRRDLREEVDYIFGNDVVDTEVLPLSGVQI
jgi:hypothetical protein